MPGLQLAARLVAMTSFALVGFIAPALAQQDTDLDAFLTEIALPPSDQAMAQIPDLGRKLLALRSYVRAGSSLEERWSWTEAEIQAFEGSDEQKALLAEVAAVNAHFSRANPGYSLYANTRVRSLDVQIERWNSNESVGAAAAEMLAGWQAEFGDQLNASRELDSDAVRGWAASFRPSKRANLAAPGLTLHGQAHAIDFQVMQDGEIIAGANSKQIETVWRAKGWDQKLKASVDAAGPSFSGPLTAPDEPWHYDYEPGSQRH